MTIKKCTCGHSIQTKEIRKFIDWHIKGRHLLMFTCVKCKSTAIIQKHKHDLKVAA